MATATDMVFLGVDVGTSSIKVGAYTLNGDQVCLIRREYPMLASEDRMCELDPMRVLSCAEGAIRAAADALPEGSIAAIGFSAQLHSLMAVDGKIRPLTNVLTWADTRADAARERLSQKADFTAMYQLTGVRIEHPISWTLKLEWLRGERPGLFQKGNRFISIKTFLLYSLTGRLFMDWSDASSTGMFNIRSFQWDDTAMGFIDGLGASFFPETLDCAQVFESLPEDAAGRLGIRAGTPLVFGAGDGMCAHLGCGAFARDAFSCTVGTSGALRVRSDAPLLDEKRRTFCYCLQRDFYVAGGAINNGGLVLAYLRELMRNQWEADEKRYGEGDFFALAEHLAGEVPPGSEGLTFLPFLTGERAPHFNAQATAVLSGLTLKHDRRHILRAAMEGVMFQLSEIYNTLVPLAGEARMIIANGGYTQSGLWLSMQADIFSAELRVSGIGEASALGAAYLAMFAMHAIPSLDTELPAMKPDRFISPNTQNRECYREAAARYAWNYRANYSGHVL